MVRTAALDRRTKQLDNDVMALHERIDEFRTEARERLDKVESAVRENTVQIGRLTEQIAGHDRRFEELTGVLDTHTDQLEHLGDNVATLAGQMDRLLAHFGIPDPSAER